MSYLSCLTPRQAVGCAGPAPYEAATGGGQLLRKRESLDLKDVATGTLHVHLGEAAHHRHTEPACDRLFGLASGHNRREAEGKKSEDLT